MVLGGALSRHLGHLVVFGIPVVAMSAGMALQEVRGRAASRARRVGATTTQLPVEAARPAPLPRDDWQRLAAGGLIAAGLVHAAVAPEHFREYLAFGVFFAVLTLVQWCTAVVWLRRPTVATARLLAGGSACVVALWVLSRTTGLPVGSQPWRPEGVAAPDLLATSFEVLTCVACLVQVWTARQSGALVRATYEGAS